MFVILFRLVIHGYRKFQGWFLLITAENDRYESSFRRQHTFQFVLPIKELSFMDALVCTEVPDS